MVKVVGVKFSSKSRKYYFSSNGLELGLNDEVIVETDRGLQFGYVVEEEKDFDEKKLISGLKNIVKKATANDKKNHNKNLQDSIYCLNKARIIADELNLNMKILEASYTFDRKQLLFNFVSDDRVDFRILAKKLAALFKTRIELRQIGIRDKAREVGGLGPCGRFLCCNSFLTDLNSVTINMAKNQMLALNPSKINGVCGRLLCCLAYEDDTYTKLKRDLPNIGDTYKYNGENYKVRDVDIFKRKIIIENNDKKEEVYINGSNK